MALPSDTQFERLIDDGIRQLKELRKNGPEVLRRARIGTTGGTRALSLVQARISANSSSDYDPTSGPAIASVDDPKRDPIRRLAVGMVDELRKAVKSLEVANSKREKTRPRTELPKPPEHDGRCVNCIRFGIERDSVKIGRCGPCADYWKEQRREKGVASDAPERLVRSRAWRTGRAVKKRPTRRVVRSTEHRPGPELPSTNGSQRPPERSSEPNGRPPAPAGTNGSSTSALEAARRLVGRTST